MQARYQIYLYFDGSQYVANVPELDGCSGTGQSYAEAVSSAEEAMATWVFDAINTGRKPPEPSKDFVLKPPSKPIGKSASTPIMRRLHQKYGNLTNRQLMDKIGIEGVSPSTFSGAAGGHGKRWVRCAIAIALDEMPSALWPHLSKTILERDDLCMPTDQQ